MFFAAKVSALPVFAGPCAVRSHNPRFNEDAGKLNDAFLPATREVEDTAGCVCFEACVEWRVTSLALSMQEHERFGFRLVLVRCRYVKPG